MKKKLQLPSVPSATSKIAKYPFIRKGAQLYRWGFVGLIIISSTLTLQTVVGLIDGMFALMAIPTMVSAIWLAPKVMRAAGQYFSSLESGSSRNAGPEL